MKTSCSFHSAAGVRLFFSAPLLLLHAFVGPLQAQQDAMISAGRSVPTPRVAFRENAGQVKDQHGQPRTDVLFQGNSEGIDFFIRNDGISYQFMEMVRVPDEERAAEHPPAVRRNRGGSSIAALSVYRVDVDWLGAQRNFTVEHGDVLPGYTNHYDVAQGQPPVLGVREFETLTCHDIWDGIDLAFHARNGVLESDWIMADPDDHAKVRFQVKGAELRVDPDGFLVMTTPFGTLREGRIQADQCGKTVDVRWVVDGDVVRIEVPHCEAGVPLRIDPPTRVWGTYIGNSGLDSAWDVDVDGAGGVYIAGVTTSTSMATSGAHQTTVAGGEDGYLARFNSNGTRSWATYYGGSGGDAAHACVRAPNGDVVVAGYVASSTGFATPGVYQTVYAGSVDAVLARFNSNGSRIWSTYFGSNRLDEAWSCAMDNSGNIYMAGSTYSKLDIASSGAHQTEPGTPSASDRDAFLVKFSPTGGRLWSTFYGGALIDQGFACATDHNGNVYLSGETNSQDMIASSGAFQEQIGGSRDTYLVKFDPSGTRLWGTYYGGAGGDEDGYCTADTLGQIFLVGTTNSDSVLATLGSYQDSIRGQYDVFVAEFDTDGVRQWGTYFGGAQGEEAVACQADGTGSMVFSGRTKSTSGIATPGAYDQVLGGGFDAYVAKFNKEGDLHWGTYYGGASNENGQGCAAARGNFVFMAGYTSSEDLTASPGAFHSSYGGGIYDMFLVKLDGCDPFPVSATAVATTICEEDSTLLIATGALSYVWAPTPSLPVWAGDSLQAYPSATTTYSVTGMDQWGCEAQASAVVNVLVVDTTIFMEEAMLTALQDGAEYQWVDCNSAFAPVPEATAQSFAPAQSGSYAAVIALAGCVDTTSCRAIVVTGIAEAVPWQFRIFPNPATEQAFYTLDGSGEHLLRILDARGRIVHSEMIQAPKQGSIALRGLEAGIYSIVLNGDVIVRTQLCVVLH